MAFDRNTVQNLKTLFAHEMTQCDLEMRMLQQSRSLTLERKLTNDLMIAKYIGKIRLLQKHLEMCDKLFEYV